MMIIFSMIVIIRMMIIKTSMIISMILMICNRDNPEALFLLVESPTSSAMMR